MCSCKDAWGKAFSLLAQEEKSILAEDISQAEVYSELRFKYLDLAWGKRSEVSHEDYIFFIQKMLAQQEKLTSLGEELKKKFQAELTQARKHEGYFTGYRYQKNAQSKSLYCSTKA